MIDVTGIAAGGVDTAFRLLKQLVVTGVLVEPDGDYDTATGGPAGSETTHAVSEIILTDYERSDIDGKIIREFDRIALFRASEVPVEITGEMLLRVSGADWDIIHVNLEPSGTLYELQIRKPQ